MIMHDVKSSPYQVIEHLLKYGVDLVQSYY